MELEIIRNPRDDCTLGAFYINGVFECRCIELPEFEDGLYGVFCLSAGLYSVFIKYSDSVYTLMALGSDGSRARIKWGAKQDTNLPDINLCQTLIGITPINSRKAFESVYSKISSAIDSGQKVNLLIR